MIQGEVRRAEHDPLLAQEAEFEACAQQWGDLSATQRGFSLMSRDKYGYDTVEPGTIRLTLLRSPESPMASKNPHHLYADQGPHDFTYAMFAHVGGWREADTELRAYELNYRLHSLPTGVHKGSFPSAHSFVEIEPKNIILTAIKMAEDNDSVIFRFYEFEGRMSQVRLTLPRSGTVATQTNLMEKEEQPLSLGSNGTEVVTAIGPYEIKSVKVEFQNVAGRTPPRRV